VTVTLPIGVKPFIVQKRMMQLGRVRLGEKGAKGEPRKLSTFRFTSASADLLKSVAARYRGTVKPWTDAPDEGYFQLVTESTELDIVLPPVFSQADGTPTMPYSQWLELWSAGGCQRRCNGEEIVGGTELGAAASKPCMCDPDNRACKITTRIEFLMPDVLGFGVWRLDSHGWNAAAELPGTLSLLHQAAAQGQFIPATLRIEHRTKKEGGETRRFIVPVVELRNMTIDQLAGGALPLAINGPPARPERPAITTGTVEPANQEFEKDDEPPRPPPPPLPNDESKAEVEPETNGATPLTKSEFDLLLEDGNVTTEEKRAAGKRLFPGKSPSKLTDAERGALWAELQKVTA
jgi:hypothetical protein